MQRKEHNMKKTKLQPLSEEKDKVKKLSARLLKQIKTRVEERMMAIREEVKLPKSKEDHLMTCIFNCIYQTYHDTKKGKFFPVKTKISKKTTKYITKAW
jgi:predicted  nucleic acid-binding Zn-ribbon protein